MIHQFLRFNYACVLLLSFMVLAGCKNNTASTKKEEKATAGKLAQLPDRDLAAIQEDGKLTVITIYNSTGYFLYRGKAMGFEYELVSELAKSLGVELEIKVAKNIDQLFSMLNKGEGDLIAYGLSITEPRKELVSFTNHHYLTHQVLVQRKPENWRRLPMYKIKRQLVSDPVELIGKTVHVRRNSSYYERLQNLMQEIGGEINIETMPGNKTTDEIIKMVVDGDIDYTLSDYNVAALNQTYYPILDVDTEVSFSQRIAWAVRKSSPNLLAKVNEWLTQIKRKSFYNVLYNKYFKNKKSYRRRIKSDFFSKNQGKISQYDPLIKKYAEKLKWDWRLLSSQIYQESRFDPSGKSWAGAGGLMQLMPETASSLGVTDISNPQQNLKAGTTYLSQMSEYFTEVPDSIQRIKFTLAAYNCGLGHVRDAQRLTEAFGENPNIWDNHVEDYMLKLNSRAYFTRPEVYYGFVRGREPFLYVKEIFLRYDHYKKLIPLSPKAANPK